MPLAYTLLGSGTLLPDDERRSAAHFVDAGDVRLLLDCGSGTVHGSSRHGVDWRRITHVAVSHFHTDHVGDVAALLFALRHGIRPPRHAPLTVLGPPGVRRFMDALAGAHGEFVLDPGFPVTVRELPRKGRALLAPGLELRCHPTPHTDASVAWRLDSADGSVGYTGDTGPDRDGSLGAFLSGVELLVSECALPDPPEVDVHPTPRSAAALARSVDPCLLVLTHVYPMLPLATVAERVREAGFAGEVRLGTDGLGAVVSRGWAAVAGSGA